MTAFPVDGPLTPEEYAEQREIYNPDIAFVDRILTAIQRFERTRKLSSERRDVFHKWLRYGGLQIGPNMFMGGVDQKNMDKDQIATALSQVSISTEIREDLQKDGSALRQYVVDFEGCVRGFLSYNAPEIWSFDTEEQVMMVTTTLERFMDYVLLHDVCPEFEEDIRRAREVCKKARQELWACTKAQRWLPGDFNRACSTLFSNQRKREYNNEAHWAFNDQQKNLFMGFTEEEAKQIIGFAIAGAADEEVYQGYLNITGNCGPQKLRIVNTLTHHGFEIIHIDNPTADCKELYGTLSKSFRPVGRVTGRPWMNPEAAPEDLTQEEENDFAQKKAIDCQTEHVFFLEEIVLQYLSVGQKVQATIRQLDCGICFFDDFARLLPSFETYLVNDMMLGYKEPQPLTGALPVEVTAEDAEGF